MRAALLLLLVSSAAQAAPCTPATLASAIHEAWGLDNVAAVACRPIRATHSLLLVESALDENGQPAKTASSMTSYAAVIDPATNQVLWHRESYAGTPGNQSTFAIADLDGDGRDEVVEHQTHEGHEGTGSETLYAYAVHDAELVEAGTLVLAITGARATGVNGCTATWAIVGGPNHRPRVQVTGSRLRDRQFQPAPETCPLDGTHRYRWTGAAFALAD